MKPTDPSYSKQEQFVNDFPEKKELLVVGLGAAAGGTEALRAFFENVPVSSGLAYVVILHLLPEGDSPLAGVLQSSTKMPVIPVTEKSTVEPDHVYVVPPNRHLTVEENVIILSPNLHEEDRRAPVDILFRTLAEAWGPRAVCVVLSGTGANGSMGLKRIKELGGTVFVQNPKEARFNEMPRNAIATDLVDEVLPVADIPKKIISYRDNLGTVEISEDALKRTEEQQHALREIFTQLRHRTGHDFTNYKRPTLLRRIERRISIRNLASLSAYAQYLKQYPDEITALLKDLLISVTNFFRDKTSWEILEHQILPQLLEHKKSEDQLRIWVAGVATGEEAYSMAMLCAEKTMDEVDVPAVQIFATDIDEAAIAVARDGYYSLNDAADISPERLSRFFNKEREGYRIKREIREMVMFANHNLFKDPPFSHLDMVSCRNVFIYLNHIAQERAAETFHFALNPAGFLFLGSSEAVDGAADLYAVYNREHHIFQKRQVQSHYYPLPESIPTVKTGQQPLQTSLEHEIRKGERMSFGDLHHQLLEQYAPPSVIINHDYEIVHLSENAGRYLQISSGEPSQNLLKLIRPELLPELRSALFLAVEQQKPVKAKSLSVLTVEQTENIIIHVKPVLPTRQAAGQGYILVLFEPAGMDNKEEAVVITSSEPVNRHLEDELIRMKLQLRTTVEQYEFQGEELKASNEELQAMNEELRSAAEELETGKEELQSMNEELRTVNQELKLKIEEWELTSNNLQNLINSVNIGTIFLDRSFRVVLFTPAIRDLFNLIAADYGRPITDITHQLAYPDLVKDAQEVLLQLKEVEREVYTNDGEKLYLMRLLPYRTSDDRINGVVITFIDITTRKKSEEFLRQTEERFRTKLEKDVNESTAELSESREQYASLVENTPDIINRWNKDLKLVFANSAFYKKTGVPLEELYGKNNSEMGQPEEVAIPFMNSLRKVFETGEALEHYNTFPTPTGEVQFYSRMVPEKNKEGEVETVLTIARDITALKNAEQEVIEVKETLAQKATDKYEMLFNSMDEGFYMGDVLLDENGIAVDVLYTEENPAAIRMSGLSAKGKKLSELDPDYKNHWIEIISHTAKTGEPQRMERFSALNNTWYNFNLFKPQIKKDDCSFAVIFQNVTERKQREEALRTSEERFRTLSNAVPQVIWASDGEGKATYFNQRWYEYSGLSYEESYGKGWEAIVHPDDAAASVKHWHTALAEGRIFDSEYRLRRADGVYRWHIGRNIPLHNDKGEILGWFGSATDIENLKVAEESLRESEERLWVTMESAIDFAIITHDENGLINGWSKGAERIFGYSEAEVKGKHCSIIFTPEDRAKGAPEWELRTAREEGRAADERWHLRKDNTRFYVSGVMRPIILNGKLNGYVKVARDMTERQTAEEAMRMSEERYRIALQSAEMGAWDWNVADDKIVWNEQNYLILGLDPHTEPLSNTGFLQMVHPDDAEKVREAMTIAVEQTGIYHTEFRITRADNAETRWMYGFGRVVATEKGKGTRIVGVMYDITERKMLEQQREEFIGIASHELKTPVTSIKAYAQILQEMFEQSADTKSVKLMQKLEGQVDRLTCLIRDLLDTTKITEGQLPLHLETFDLNDLINDHIEELQRLSNKHQLIWQPGVGFSIRADKERIGQVITNLISNAIKYSPEGGHVIINCHTQDGTATVSVQDYGIGIPVEVQQKVFDRFFRVRHQQVNTYPGMGLGLYITAGIIHRHGGSITVQSKPGEGSVFSFTLPLKKSQ